MKIKTILGYTAIAFILFFVIEDPVGATHLVDNIGSFLSSAARGISNVFGEL